jgi:hypothetical protein
MPFTFDRSRTWRDNFFCITFRGYAYIIGNREAAIRAMRADGVL